VSRRINLSKSVDNRGGAGSAAEKDDPTDPPCDTQPPLGASQRMEVLLSFSNIHATKAFTKQMSIV
jgi:hypothetical protein